MNYSVSLRKNMGKDSVTYPKKAYANVQLTDTMDLTEFSKHIAEHGSVYNRGDIYNVLSQAVDCMRELVLKGNKISFGDLGDFSPSISSKGAETVADFSAANITKVSVKWTKGSNLKNFRSEAEFTLVASRENQAKLVKAEKAGSTTVNISTDTSSSSSTTTGGTTTGGSTDSGSSSQQSGGSSSSDTTPEVTGE